MRENATSTSISTQFLSGTLRTPFLPPTNRQTMGKSIRSHSKKRFRTIKRNTVGEAQVRNELGCSASNHPMRGIVMQAIKNLRSTIRRMVHSGIKPTPAHESLLASIPPIGGDPAAPSQFKRRFTFNTELRQKRVEAGLEDDDLDIAAPHGDGVQSATGPDLLLNPGHAAADFEAAKAAATLPVDAKEDVKARGFHPTDPALGNKWMDGWRKRALKPVQQRKKRYGRVRLEPGQMK